MSQFLVRNLSPHAVSRLKSFAKSHHRSLQGEIKYILEKVATIPADKLTMLLGESANTGWPADFLASTIGGWQGDDLERPAQGRFEKRDELE